LPRACYYVLARGISLSLYKAPTGVAFKGAAD